MVEKGIWDSRFSGTLSYADFDLNSLLLSAISPPGSMKCRVEVRHGTGQQGWMMEYKSRKSL